MVTQKEKEKPSASHFSHNAFLQRATIHTETLLAEALHLCLYKFPMPARDKSESRNTGNKRVHLHSIVGLNSGLVAKFPATVHFSSYLGMDSDRTAQVTPLVHPFFQGHLC